VNAEARRSAGVRAGDVVTITLEPDSAEFCPSLDKRWQHMYEAYVEKLAMKAARASEKIASFASTIQTSRLDTLGVLRVQHQAHIRGLSNAATLGRLASTSGE
jgi:hypothetical protein